MTHADEVLDAVKRLARDERTTWNQPGVDRIDITLRWKPGDPQPRVQSVVSKHHAKIAS